MEAAIVSTTSCITTLTTRRRGGQGHKGLVGSKGANTSMEGASTQRYYWRKDPRCQSEVLAEAAEARGLTSAYWLTASQVKTLTRNYGLTLKGKA